MQDVNLQTFSIKIAFFVAIRLSPPSTRDGEFEMHRVHCRRSIIINQLVYTDSYKITDVKQLKPVIDRIQ